MASVFPPIYFRSNTDGSSRNGSPTLTGAAGDLINLLSSCLICNKSFTAISGASFVDNTAAARTTADAGFALFQGPTINVDEAYIGMSSPFKACRLQFSTPGVQATAVTLAWEYWNGTTWTALSGVTDGTSGLTADGNVTWTMPALTGTGAWATTSVNGQTMYWMRVRFTAGSWTTNPLVSLWSVTGWNQPFLPNAGQAVYQMGGGNQMYMNVNDSGSIVQNEAQITGFETMTAFATGTGQFPTIAQLNIGIGAVVWRKSATTTAVNRQWQLIADDRTVYLFVSTGDSAGCYMGYGFGDFYSYVSNDLFRTFIVGRNASNSASLSSISNLAILGHAAGAASIPTTGVYWARHWSGTGGSYNYGADADKLVLASLATPENLACIGQGQIPFPNAPDGGIYMTLVQHHDSLANKRGRYRGLWSMGHPIANFTDLDTFGGTGTLAGRTFVVVKTNYATGANQGLYVLETSDTWETN